MIKIGTNFLSLRDTSIEDFIRTAYDLRLDCIDFHFRAFPSTDAAYLSKIKMMCLQYGLPIGYIGMSGLFIGTAAERREHAENCREAIDLAAFLGSPIIRLFCKTMPEKNGDGDDPWPAMVSGYQEVADYAATATHGAGLIDTLREKARARGSDPAHAERVLGSRPETMRATLAWLEQAHGGATAYMRTIGLPDETVSRLRTRLGG